MTHRSGRLSVSVIAFVLITMLPSTLSAQLSNHDRILPDFGNFAFDTANIFFGGEIRGAFPMGYTGEQKLTGYGAGGMLEAGYDLDGWLAGLRFSANFYDNTDTIASNDFLFKVFNHFQISLQISKLLGKGILPFMPEWLDLRANVGAGIDIAYADYYKSANDKIWGLSSQTTALAGVYNFALFAEMNNFQFDSDDDSLSTELVIPYAGFNLEMMTDKGGLMLMPTVALGVRTTMARILGITPDLYKGNPGVTARVRQATFSPDGDGNSDILKMDIRTKLYDGAALKNWTITVFTPNNRVFFEQKGEGAVPAQFVWDGKSAKGELVQSATDYPVVVSVTDTKGKTNTAKTVIAVDILVVVDGSNLKILVPSIEFDANAATFATLSKEKKAANVAILQQVAKALKKYADYKVTVEGHANNVSGTEKEEVNELIPLSGARADAIKKELVKLGIDGARLSTVGMGGRKPVTKNADELWKNRRVEFILSK